MKLAGIQRLRLMMLNLIEHSSYRNHGRTELAMLALYGQGGI